MTDSIIVELNQEDAMVLGIAMTETPHLPWGQLADKLALAIMDQKTGPVGPAALEVSDEEIERTVDLFRARLGIEEPS